MKFKKVSLLTSVAVLTTALMFGVGQSYAQKGGKSGGGHDSGVEHSDSGGKGGQQGGKGQGRGGGEGQSLKDVFKDTESGAGESSKTDEHGSSTVKGASSTKKGGTSSTRGKSTTTEQGKKGSAGAKKGGKTTPAAAEESDSDKPAWAGTKGGKAGGNTASGTKKGDIYGDMYVLLRDADGKPILTPEGFVQPLGADGQPLAVDAEGNFDSTLAIAVDLGRLSVSRASSSVLTSQLKTAVDSLNAADSITLDAAGRLVVTKDGVASAIDSPLENLALYKEILTTGTISGLTDATISKLTSSTNTTLSALGTAGVTTGDLSAAASFLGAASDKTIKLTVDAVVDINTILGINTKSADGTTTYYSYSTFSFNPATAYASTTVDVLVKQDVTLSDGTTKTVYVPTTTNVSTLFSTQTESTNVAAFTQAADDSRTIINYVHDNSIATE